MATNDPSGSSDNTVQVTVANNIAYAGTSNQDVYALRANNGSLLWHARVEGSVQELPLIEHGIVYISSLVGQGGPAYLSALRTSDGILLWRYRSNSYIYQPVVGNNQLYIGEQKDGITALQVNNGKTVWHVTGATNQSPSLFNNTLYASISSFTQADGVYALRTKDGSVLWNYQTTAASTLTIQGGVIYTCCLQGVFSALRISNGHLIWSKALDITFTSEPKFVDGAIYLMTTKISLEVPTTASRAQGFRPPFLAVGQLLGGNSKVSNTLPLKTGKTSLYALRVDDGALLWQQSLQDNESFSGSFQISQGIIYTSVMSVQTQNSMILTALQSSDGRTIWQDKLEGDANGLILNEDVLYTIGAADKSALYALNMKDGRTLWSHSINANTYNQPELIEHTQILISANNGIIYTLRADTGALLWQYQTYTSS